MLVIRVFHGADEHRAPVVGHQLAANGHHGLQARLQVRGKVRLGLGVDARVFFGLAQPLALRVRVRPQVHRAAHQPAPVGHGPGLAATGPADKVHLAAQQHVAGHGALLAFHQHHRHVSGRAAQLAQRHIQRPGLCPLLPVPALATAGVLQVLAPGQRQRVLGQLALAVDALEPRHVAVALAFKRVLPRGHRVELNPLVGLAVFEPMPKALRHRCVLGHRQHRLPALHPRRAGGQLRRVSWWLFVHGWGLSVTSRGRTTRAHRLLLPAQVGHHGAGCLQHGVVAKDPLVQAEQITTPVIRPAGVVYPRACVQAHIGAFTFAAVKVAHVVAPVSFHTTGQPLRHQRRRPVQERLGQRPKVNGLQRLGLV